MCDILHARHVKAYLRFDTLFNLTNVKQKQEKLLEIIHGLTRRVNIINITPPYFLVNEFVYLQVIKEKKAIFEKNYNEGIIPTPSLSQIISDDYNHDEQKVDNKKHTGLRDDLDEIDENDIGN